MQIEVERAGGLVTRSSARAAARAQGCAPRERHRHRHAQRPTGEPGPRRAPHRDTGCGSNEARRAADHGPGAKQVEIAPATQTHSTGSPCGPCSMITLLVQSAPARGRPVTRRASSSVSTSSPAITHQNTFIDSLRARSARVGLVAALVTAARRLHLALLATLVPPARRLHLTLLATLVPPARRLHLTLLAALITPADDLHAGAVLRKRRRADRRRACDSRAQQHR